MLSKEMTYREHERFIEDIDLAVQQTLHRNVAWAKQQTRRVRLVWS